MPPRKKSPKEHKKTGTYRPSVHGVDELPVACPSKPGDLSPAAEAFWNVVSQHLEYAGYLTRIDGQALRLAAESWSIYLQAIEEIQELGITVEEQRGSGDKGYVIRKRNPAIDIRNQAWDQLYKFFQTTGMTPQARNGLTTRLADSGDDEEQRVNEVLGFG